MENLWFVKIDGGTRYSVVKFTETDSAENIREYCRNFGSMFLLVIFMSLHTTKGRNSAQNFSKFHVLNWELQPKKQLQNIVILNLFVNDIIP